MIQLKTNPYDGTWLTSEYSYKDRILQVKSKLNHGMKVHCWKNNKIQWTLRYSFIPVEELLNRAKLKIDNEDKKLNNK